jgi:hypothetical protein
MKRNQKHNLKIFYCIAITTILLLMLSIVLSQATIIREGAFRFTLADIQKASARAAAAKEAEAAKAAAAKAAAAKAAEAAKAAAQAPPAPPAAAVAAPAAAVAVAKAAVAVQKPQVQVNTLSKTITNLMNRNLVRGIRR